MIAPMESDRIEKLTEAQRVCLRMVLMHLSSKDIARELGISPHTVDQRPRNPRPAFDRPRFTLTILSPFATSRLQPEV